MRWAPVRVPSSLSVPVSLKMETSLIERVDQVTGVTMIATGGLLPTVMARDRCWLHSGNLPL